jgi:hypothetical protein
MNYNYYSNVILRQAFQRELVHPRSIFYYTSFTTQNIGKCLCDEGFFKAVPRIGVPSYRFTKEGLIECFTRFL